MNHKKLVDSLLEHNPELMRKISIANECSLTEALNQIKRNKAIINFHCSVYNFQQKNLYEPIALAAALIDMKQYLQIMLDKLNELNKY
jgi:hypothetical protein